MSSQDPPTTVADPAPTTDVPPPPTTTTTTTAESTQPQATTTVAPTQTSLTTTITATTSNELPTSNTTTNPSTGPPSMTMTESTLGTTTTTTPYTTHYITTVSFVTITTIVPETTIISGSVTTVYDTEITTTLIPTVIPDPQQHPPSTVNVYQGAHLRIWQLALAIVAILVLIFGCASIFILVWIRRRRNKKKQDAMLTPVGMRDWNDPNSTAMAMGSPLGLENGDGGVITGGEGGRWSEYDKETGLVLTDNYTDSYYLSREPSMLARSVTPYHPNNDRYSQYHLQESQSYMHSNNNNNNSNNSNNSCAQQEDYHPASYRDDYTIAAALSRQPVYYPPPPSNPNVSPNMNESPPFTASRITRDDHEQLSWDRERDYSESSVLGSGTGSRSDLDTSGKGSGGGSGAYHERNAMYELHRKSPQALLEGFNFNIGGCDGPKLQEQQEQEQGEQEEQRQEQSLESLPPRSRPPGDNGTGLLDVHVAGQIRQGEGLESNTLTTSTAASSARGDDRGSWASDGSKVRRFLHRLRASEGTE